MPHTPVPFQRPRRSTAAGIIGNVLEWYDFAIFAFLAPVIGARFFSPGDPVASLLQVFAVFAVGYLVRPLGGALFGHVGARYGRRPALIGSVVLMAVSTTLLGLLPTHAAIGLWAPVFLVTVRLLQGLSVGGELIGSIVWLAELAPARRRGLFTSWATLSATAGMLLGSGVGTLLQATLSHSEIAAFGWRLPFLAGAVLGGVAFWLRRGLEESPAFIVARVAAVLDKHPVRAALRQQPWAIAHLCTLLPLFAGGFYMLFVWMPTYLGRLVVPPVENSLLMNTVAMAVLIALIPLGGLASDHLGRRRVLLATSVAFLLLAVPLFLLLNSGEPFLILGALLAAAVLMAFLQGTIPATMVELFPGHIRSSAAGLGYNLAVGVIGGTTPLLCTWLIERSGSMLAPAFYLMLLSAVSAVAASRLDRVGLMPRQR